MTGGLVLPEILRAPLELPPCITVVIMVLGGLMAAAPKILRALPPILRALTERRVVKAIKTEEGALTALQILQSAALTAPDGSGRRSGARSHRKRRSPPCRAVPPPS